MPAPEKTSTLHELFIDKLRVLYDVEMLLVKAMPKMAKAVQNQDLQNELNIHLSETKQQVARLKKCFSLLHVRATKLESEGMRGLINDAKWVLQHRKGPALDANIIAAAQYIEHYEIAGYGSAIAWAKLMKHTKVADLLEETLKEENLTDETLTNIATKKVNKRVEVGMKH